MDRSDLPDDDPESFRPPLPPDDRLWRHPSELGGTWSPPPRRSRVPRLIAVGALGMLTVVVVATWLVSRSPSDDLAASITGTSLAPTTRASLALPTTAAMVPTSLAVATTVAATTASPRTTARRPASTATSAAPTAPTPAPAGGADTSTTSSSTSPATTTAPAAPVALARLVAVHGGSAEVATATLLEGGVLVTTGTAVGEASTFTAVLDDGRQVAAQLLARDDESGVAVFQASGGNLPVTALGTAVEAQPGTTLSVASARTAGAQGSCTLQGMGVDAVVSGRTLRHLLRLDGVRGDVADGDVVVDGAGRVIGIVARSHDGQAMAVPIDLARSVARSVARDGKVVVPWLGVSGSDLDAEQAARAGAAGGALVVDVAAGSPAAAAGIEPGHAIVAVGGRPVRSMAALVLALRGHSPGEAVALSIWHDGATKQVSVVLQARG